LLLLLKLLLVLLRDSGHRWCTGLKALLLRRLLLLHEAGELRLQLRLRLLLLLLLLLRRCRLLLQARISSELLL
jgi:hypothetical protein